MAVVLLGVAALLVAWWRGIVLPRRPARAPTPPVRRWPSNPGRPAPDGTGVRLVVNPASGLTDDGVAAQLRADLPGAEVIELGEGDDLRALLGDTDPVAIGAAGGDGTLSAVAAIAADQGCPLVAIPAGTLNHLARDLCLDSVADAVAAVRAGTVTSMDLGVAGERTFVNTLTLGGYTAVVDERERLEARLGKRLGLAVALVRELPRMAPLPVEIDGTPRKLWLAWVGNGRYGPDGLAPAWREELADGLLDVRLVHGARRFSRTRFALSALTGQLPRSRVYSEHRSERLTIRSLDGPLRIGIDGETFDAPAELVVSKRPAALLVAVPPA